MCMMKLGFDDHFLGYIAETSKFKNVLKTIWSKLTRKQLLLFKNYIFRHFINLKSYAFSSVIIHNLLLKQVAREEINED